MCQINLNNNSISVHVGKLPNKQVLGLLKDFVTVKFHLLEL